MNIWYVKFILSKLYIFIDWGIFLPNSTWVRLSNKQNWFHFTNQCTICYHIKNCDNSN